MSFGENFIWGAASAAYQIEGAASEDGRGPSIWDVYCHDKRMDSHRGRTNILNQDSGDIACDHYHLYKEDVKLMKELGIKAYRFSISWSRIFPEGVGKVNKKGLQFYSSLVDELLAAGIEPYITLFHWDLPQGIQNLGGWQNPQIIEWFKEYIKVVVEALSDRVCNWITLNEPQCHIIIGHLLGECAPKIKLSYSQIFKCMHHMFLAHGTAVKTIREFTKIPCKIGYAPCASAVYPTSDHEQDIAAARNAAFTIKDKNLWNTSWWIDPIILGKYPVEGIAQFKDDFPMEMIQPGDMELIAQPLDFLGINLYSGEEIAFDKINNFTVVEKKAGFDQTAFKWAVTPRILQYMPQYLYERYHLPILITENGLSSMDWISVDGKIHDMQRIDFMYRYLKELENAVMKGIPILGYMAWSIMDNFEWSDGYGERFGLIYVDYDTQKRSPKDSYYWYKSIINQNGQF